MALDSARPESYYYLGILLSEESGAGPEQLELARTYFRSFLSKAEGHERYQEAVEEVVGNCERRQPGCAEGRLSELDRSLEYLMARPN